MTTIQEFETSTLFKRYELFKVDFLLSGYDCYATAQENGVSVALQANDGLVTLFRVAGEDADLTKPQKLRIFEFACDFIYGSGKSDEAEFFDKFIKQFAEKLATGQIHNTFLLNGINAGFITNSSGGLRGLDCRTTLAEHWEPSLSDSEQT